MKKRKILAMVKRLPSTEGGTPVGGIMEQQVDSGSEDGRARPTAELRQLLPLASFSGFQEKNFRNGVLTLARLL